MKRLGTINTLGVVLIHCNIVTNDYQHYLKALYTFVPNKSFSELPDISPKIFVFLKLINVEFSDVEFWLADQNSKSLEIEDKINIHDFSKINITLVIN